MDTVGPRGRLFIAAELPESIVRAAAQYADLLEASFPGRYVPAQNYHVTLAFLGLTPLVAIRDLDQAVTEALCGIAPCTCALAKPGAFGKQHSAIVWAGLTNSEYLAGLARRIRRELDIRGFSYDTKPARPHITLARGVDLTGRRLPPLPEASGEISKVAVFQSMRRDGALIYLPEVAISLG